MIGDVQRRCPIMVGQRDLVHYTADTNQAAQTGSLFWNRLKSHYPTPMIKSYSRVDTRVRPYVNERSRASQKSTNETEFPLPSTNFMLYPVADLQFCGHVAENSVSERHPHYFTVDASVTAAVIRYDHGVVWRRRSSVGELDGRGAGGGGVRLAGAAGAAGASDGMMASRRSRSCSGTVTGISPVSRSEAVSCWRYVSQYVWTQATRALAQPVWRSSTQAGPRPEGVGEREGSKCA